MFKEKDEVLVGSLGKLGVIVGTPKPGWYDVRVGGLQVRARAQDLKPRAELSKSALKALKRIAKPVAGAAKSPPRDALKVDLHGMRVEEAMRVVEKAMDRALIEGFDRMEIVHGIGTGRIRDALHKYLSQLSVVGSFKLDAANAGVTLVYF